MEGGGILIAMCGIAAILRQDRCATEHEIRAMTQLLAHRGPDGEGVWVQGRVALGHRRLSIIDLETGRQPMSNEDGSIWISFNGEVYNFRELRSQLEQKGHVFRTKSDTEVIVHAYEEWGKTCTEHFRGMFAFCIIDTRKQCLFFARDHFGIKPLYYFQWNGCFACASELQALKTLEEFPHALDLEVLDQYLWLQYIPAPKTIFKRVKKLPPAHCLTVSFDGVLQGPEQYWDTQFEPDAERTQEEWLEELESVLKDSIQVHLVADVPFGAFLSGGVDSSTVVAYMRRILNHPVKTFTIGFEEEDFSELPFAEEASKHIGTEHIAEIVRPDALGILPELVRHYGEPFGDSSAIPTYYVSRLAREHVPMVLSGDGGDEAFGGYQSYMSWMENPGIQTTDRWISLMQYLPRDWRVRLWREEYRHVVQERLAIFDEAFSRTEGQNPLHRVQDVDRRTYLPFSILTKVDVASMMHGLEVRTPFLDVRVWDTISRIPANLSMGKNTRGAWEGKLLLKKLIERWYPPELVHRRKTGFGIPLARWFAKEGACRQQLEDRLFDSSSLLSEYFDPAVIKELIDTNFSGPLWLLLFLDEWLRQTDRALERVVHTGQSCVRY